MDNENLKITARVTMFRPIFCCSFCIFHFTVPILQLFAQVEKIFRYLR